MNRRGFLKMLGRGAVAAVAPKGAIAKALTNLPTGGAPKIDAGKALLNFIDTAYNVRSHPGSLIDKYSLTVNTLSNFLLALKQTGLTTDPQLLYDIKHNIKVDSTILKYLKKELTQQQAFDMLQKYDAVDLLDLDDSIDDFNLQSAIDNYYNILDHMDESLSRTIHQLFQHNLISPEIQSQLENKHNIYKCDYMNDPDSKARRNERRKKEREKNRKDNYNNIAKDINYSQFDYAGGNKDVGYAKYYEKVKTFDQLLSVVKEADDDIISGDTEGIEPGETGMPRGFGHPDRNRNYDDTIRLNVIYGVPEDVDNAYNTAAGKKLQQFVKQQLPWIDEYSWSIFNHPRLTFSDIASIIQNVYNDFRYWVEKEDYDKNAKHHVERKEKAMYFIQQYPNALENFSKVFKYEEFLYGDSPSNPENVSNYPLNVSLYDTTRELGGHEEGGWWYDVVRLVYSIPVTNLKQAEAAAKKLYNNLNKVNIDGKPTIILEKYKGSIDTTNRPKPRYE